MNKKVLIIEDNKDIRENIVEILELSNYTVFEANNGKAGIELALNHLPDVILCDIMMPDLDGYGVLNILKKHTEAGTIPFIFLTAKAEHHDLRKGMELGADDYLTKPFDDVDLINAIESRIKKKETQLSLYSRSLDRLNNLISKKDGLVELKKIINERKSRQFKKSQIVYYEGDKGYGLYVIISGKVKTIKLEENGHELITGIYSTDDYLGINVILSNDHYNETATAMEDTYICMIPKEQIDQLLNLYPEVARSFIKVLAGNIKDKEEQLMQMAFHSVRKKIAEAIIRLYRKQDQGDACFKVGREDLAAMAGMASETVSRTLSDFKNEGLIEKKGSILTILNIDKLISMKN